MGLVWYFLLTCAVLAIWYMSLYSANLFKKVPTHRLVGAIIFPPFAWYSGSCAVLERHTDDEVVVQLLSAVAALVLCVGISTLFGLGITQPWAIAVGYGTLFCTPISLGIVFVQRLRKQKGQKA